MTRETTVRVTEVCGGWAVTNLLSSDPAPQVRYEKQEEANEAADAYYAALTDGDFTWMQAGASW